MAWTSKVVLRSSALLHAYGRLSVAVARFSGLGEAGSGEVLEALKKVDCWIFVTHVLEAVRIRTGERLHEAARSGPSFELSCFPGR
jgi:hypothetical protein